MEKILATRYNSEKLAGKTFDTLVIGSGISGLTTACLLAKRGQKVAVLERHYMAGGLTHYFKRKEFEWDVGLHYIGEADSGRSMSRKIFDYITDGELQWHRIADPYDQGIFPDQTYDFVSGENEFLEKMCSYFPEERKAIEEYLRLIKEAVYSSKAFYGARVLPPVLGKAVGYFFDNKFFKYSDQTVLQVLSRLTNNEKLIAVLTTQWGDYGLPPHKASFMMHAMVAKHYLKGACFPYGGSKNIARTIIKTLRKNGADVYVRADVEKVLVRKGKSYGVLMKNGDEIYAKNIVSSAGIFNTYHSFLKQEDLGSKQESVERSFETLNRSASHVSLYLGLNKTSQELGLTPGNQWIFPSYNHKKNIESFLEGQSENFPVTYVSFPSAKDPLWEEEHPGVSTIDVIAFMPFSRFMKWENTSWYKRGAEYLDLKEQITEKLLATTIENNPTIKDHIVVKELSTPLSTKHFANYKEGEIYGLDHDPQRFRNNLLRPQTPIKNLYLTGQDTVSAGVCGGLNAGLLTSMALMKKNLQKDVQNFSVN